MRRLTKAVVIGLVLFPMLTIPGLVTGAPGDKSTEAELEISGPVTSPSVIDYRWADLAQNVYAQTYIDSYTIYEIQGAGHVSPRVGEEVETSGVVTWVESNGFYLQDPTGDGDPNTSDGIFVYTQSSPTQFVSDSVTLRATVSEYVPGGVSTGNLSICSF